MQKSSVEKEDDIKLYQEFLKGEKESFNEIIKKYRKKLIAFAYTYVKNIEEAEELAQDAFVYLLKNPTEYKTEYSLKTYLYMIVKCRAINYIKKRKRIVQYNDYYREEDVGETLEELVIKSEDRKQIMQAIRRIIPQYQLVLFLREIEQLQYKEISGILGKSVTQVKVLIYRARKALAKEIKKEGKSK